MPNLFEVFDRLKATRREFEAVADAVQRLRDAVQAHEVPAPSETSLRDLDAARRQLEPTYLIRLWAEFETALRSYRRKVVRKSKERIGTRDLIDWAQGIEDGRKVDAGMRDLVHRVREYRNSLVHERDDMAPAVGLVEARKWLSTFLAKLPERW